MITSIGGVVAGGASSRDDLFSQSIVEAANPGDRNREGVEQFLTARDGLAILRSSVGPCFVQREHLRIKRIARRIAGERVVDAHEKVLVREVNRPTSRATGSSQARKITAASRRKLRNFGCVICSLPNPGGSCKARPKLHLLAQPRTHVIFRRST